MDSLTNTADKPIVFLTGQNGMLGRQITAQLASQYHIHGLSRNSSANNPSWNYRESLKKLGIKAPDIMLHLAGAGIADKRWTRKYKQTIYDSRICGTQWLVDEIMLYEDRPQTFLSASAIGYYGGRPNETLYEDSEPGNNFVAKVAQHWERATDRLKDTETRVVNLRFGVILAKSGGALKDMLLPFKLGLGGKLGSGQQQYSWISIADAIAAMAFLIQHNDCQGPYNLTAPQSVSNQAFTQSLAKVVNRPAFMHMPTFVVRLIFGEMADELLLADAKVSPKKLLDAGFVFKHPKLTEALNNLLS